jgi:hypothetical protein
MNVRTFAAFVIGLAAAGTVSAQSVTLKAKIPFSFVIDSETLPAGEYSVRQISPGTMIIKGVDHSAAAVTIVSPTSTQGGSQETSRLVFNRYGERYFLAQIWTDGVKGGQLPVSRHERELIASRAKVNQAVVAALH